jgi:ribosome-binding factor A
MKSYRPARIARVIRETASETVLFKLRDPLVKNVTVTRAEVSADLQRAKVFVSIMGTEQEQQQCLAGLQRAAGFVQKFLGERLKMRFTPTLLFVLDKGVKNSLEIARLLREAQSAVLPAADARIASKEVEASAQDERP